MTGTLRWSDMQCRLYGIDPAARDSVTIDTWLQTLDPDDRAAVQEQRRADFEAGNISDLEYRVVTPDGVRWVSCRAQMYRDPDGRKLRMTGITFDITERHLLEEALRALTADLEARVHAEVAAREAAQVRAAQAERMQALGQLAGGIAHDFNNVLQAVMGALTLINRRPEDHAGVRRMAQIGNDAAERGASITRRLLAFSRRGELRAEPLDVASVLTGITEILTYTLGVNVEVRLDLRDNLEPVLADRGQLQAALVNLATNARDAMPSGGVLTIRADIETVAPGSSHMQPG